MNRILPTVVAFLSFMKSKFQEIITQFSLVDKDDCDCSPYKVAGFESMLNGKLKYFLIILFSVFVNSVSGQVTQPTAWTKAYDTNATLAYTGLSFPIATGSNRILVVAITSTLEGGGDGTQADPTTITYGGVTLTKATGNGVTSGRMHTWLYYLKDNAAVMDATSRAFNLTGGAISNSRNLANMSVWYAVYAGVDQSATYTTGNGYNNSTPNNATASLSTAMAVNANDQAVYISSTYNDNSTTLPGYTINANWTSGGLNSGSFNSGGDIAWKNQVANRAIPVSNTTDNAVTSAIIPNGRIRYAMSAISLPSLIPTITSLGSASGCPGSSITINGTNLAGAAAANVKIGGTAVTSITSNTATQIVAVIGAGTTGNVTVTNSNGTATSAGNFTVSPSPTTANAGADQSGSSTSFIMAANTATPGTGAWSIASGPSTSLTQFSDTTNPTATFTPVGSGTYVLNWTITNSCGSSSDQVTVTVNCVSNLISNGDFSNSSSGNDRAVNWVKALSWGSYVETNPENSYFGTGNSGFTAELDKDASLRQVVTVVPNVSYTVSFLYARRPDVNTPATVAVNINITGGASTISSPANAFNASDANPKIGTFTFTPTSASIGIEFYNSLAGTKTVGTIIDNIVLIPSSQVTPYATTNPKGVFNTLTSCAGVSVQLDVDNVSDPSIAYAWTGSGGAVFSPSANVKNPTVTFTSSGIQGATVTATTAGGCSGSPSTTSVNVTAVPAITTQPSTPAATCSGSGTQTISVVATGAGLTYSWRKDGVAVANGGVISGQGTATLKLTSPVAANTGSYDVVVGGTCSPAATSSAVPVTVNASLSVVTVTPNGAQTICDTGSGTLLTAAETDGGVITAHQWGKRSVSGGAITAISGATGSTYTPTGAGLTGGTWFIVCTSTPTCGTVKISNEVTVTVSALTTVLNASGSFTVPAGVTSLQVECWGGGGSGGGSASNSVKGGGGGGAGGAYIKSTVSVSAGNYTVTVGAVKAGTTAAGVQGNPSWFGTASLIYAEGGAGGAAPNNTTVLGGVGSSGSTVTSGTLITKSAGTNGANGTTAIGGAGGNGASTTSPEGLGGAQTTSENDGNAGASPGGGGGGAFLRDNSNHTGGVGGAGRVTITIAASVTVVASPSGAICAGTSVTFTATPTNSGTTPTYKWYKGVTPISGETASTYTTTTLANGDAITCEMTSNATPCLTISPATSNVVTMTVNTTPVAPVVNSVVLTCNQTATTATWAAVANVTEYRFDLSLYPLFGTFVTGYENILVAPSATPSIAVNGLTPGATYYARARTVSSCGTSIPSNTATLSVPIIKSADGGVTWDKVVLDGTQRAIFTASATMSATVNACSCQINKGVKVSVGYPEGSAQYLTDKNANAILKLENGLDVDLDPTSTLTFENNASLIQNNDAAVNTGVIVYNRTAQAMKNFDFTYWSSPVAGQTLFALSPNTLADKYYSFENNAWKTELNGAATMDFGKGYIIRVPKPNFWPVPADPTYAQPVQFKGTPNNGVQSLVIGLNDGDANLIGNPYPSAMSADVFLATNNKELDGTIYFWTHNTAISNLAYSASDYASYNGVGGTNTSGNFIDSNNNGFKDPGEEQIANRLDGNIAAGQSFFTVTKRGVSPTGKVTFNNSMRVGVADKNAQFFKGSNSKATTVDKHRVWLNLTNTEGAFKQTLVGYVTGATLGNDSAFDGESFDGNPYIDFYSINDSKNLVIQGRALPFDKTDKVTLGYKTTVEGTFAISIDQVDGALENQTVFVEDKVANVIHNLKNGSYSFTTAIGVFNDRFVLRYMDNTPVVPEPEIKDPIVIDPEVKDPVVTNPIVPNPEVKDPIVLDPNNGSGTLGTEGFENKGRAVVVSVKDHQIKINSFDETIGTVMVYDLRGRLLYQNKHVNKNEFIIYNLDSSNQFLIVLTQLINGKWITKEIVF